MEQREVARLVELISPRANPDVVVMIGDATGGSKGSKIPASQLRHGLLHKRKNVHLADEFRTTILDPATHELNRHLPALVRRRRGKVKPAMLGRGVWGLLLGGGGRGVLNRERVAAENVCQNYRCVRHDPCFWTPLKVIFF